MLPSPGFASHAATAMPPHLRDSSTPHDTTAPVLDAGGEDVVLRPLVSQDEYQACVALQVDVWGVEFSDIIPASMLQVAAHVGGLVIGAFAGDALLGFVFGLTGVKNDEIVHWSHMLGVRVDAREMGIGRRLKEYQRSTLARRGVKREFWTFDPLQARNAHLNLTRLGVRVIDYVVNMYGDTGSPLHFGMATDRLIVECSTTSVGDSTPAAGVPSSRAERLPILTSVPRPGDAQLNGDRPAMAMIEIPADARGAAAQSPEAMVAWRMATRAHFQWAFLNGYRVTALHRDRTDERAFYVISRAAHDVIARGPQFHDDEP